MKQVNSYEELNVNAYGVLKPPLQLWLIMLIETWHLWSLFLIIESRETRLFAMSSGWTSFAVEMPALIVCLALSRRVPKAPKFVRALWHRGRELLTLSAAGNIGIIVASAVQVDFWSLDSEWVSVGTAFLHVWVLVRLWVRPIIRQVFSEFPDWNPHIEDFSHTAIHHPDGGSKLEPPSILSLQIHPSHDASRSIILGSSQKTENKVR